MVFEVLLRRQLVFEVTVMTGCLPKAHMRPLSFCLVSSDFACLGESAICCVICKPVSDHASIEEKIMCDLTLPLLITDSPNKAGKMSARTA